MRYIYALGVAIVLVPVCALLGYFIGYLFGPLLFADDLHPDFYEHDRQLIGAVYGIPLAGGVIYSGALYLIWRLTRRARS